MYRNIIKKTIIGRVGSAVALIAGLICPSFSYSAEKTIRLGLLDNEYPPYLMPADGGVSGIVGDTLIEVSNIIGYRVDVLTLPKKRVQLGLNEGRLDAVASALEWEEFPSAAVWTDGIINVSDNVLMIEEGHFEINTAAQLSGKTIAIMQDYQYPSLDKMIASGAIRAVRANQFISLFRMVERGRVDYGIVDQNVGNWVIRQNKLKFDKALHFSHPGFDEVDFRIILFSQKWQPFVQKFNAALAKFKLTDGWKKILNKYR